LGSVTISRASPADLGWVGAACVAAGLVYLLSREKKARLRR
jgi:predicted MFS family arabinose efflux permease